MFLRVSIYTAVERNEAVTIVREAIRGCEGWIVNHSLFSNLLVTVNFELPYDRIDLFIETLKDAKFNPKIEGEMPVGEAGDVRGQLAITFLHQDPDLRRDVPPFG